MIESLDLLHRTDEERMRRRLAGLIRDVLVSANGKARVVRIQTPVEGADPLGWLRAQPAKLKTYWSARDGSEEAATIGIADVCTSDAPVDLGVMRDCLGSALALCPPEVRYYGGLRFDAAQPSGSDWKPFGAFRFVLPRFELRRVGNEVTFACHLVLPRDAALLDVLLAETRDVALREGMQDGELPPPLRRSDHPDFGGWCAAIDWAMDAFAARSLEKIVLAREVTFELEAALDPALLLHRLKGATPGCAHFLMQPVAGTAFVGASPERLFRRKGRQIESEALAGTRPRGASVADDARLSAELQGSDKDQREHEFVRRSLRERLGPLCTDFHIDAAPSEMRLARARHLVSSVRGTLREDVTSLDVLRALHPTPAVGGTPREAAVAALRIREPFDRGWYAGPIGWIGPDAAEFAVGIRSGLVREDRLSLYSGAGIVPGSTPENEWCEIEQKIADFVTVLGMETVAG